MANGKMSLNLEEFDLVELARDILSRLNEQLINAKCEISFDVTVVDPLMVTWDRFRIEQVIINLMTNAMKYGQGKPIHLSIWSDGNGVRIAVQDRGIGIAEVDRERIFQRFERAVSGRHFAGLGLGLYIVKQLVESHGGKIEVTSRLNEGSTFTVSIPRKAENVTVKPSELDVQAAFFPSEYAIPKPHEVKS
jgi:signal transduction histidine kinase